MEVNNLKKLIKKEKIATLVIVLGIFVYSNFAACFEIIIKVEDEVLPKFIKGICYMSLDSNYLVAIIAFYGAVIAFFIPFTIEMSNKLKAQYGSEIISKKFESEKIVKKLYIKLLINTFIASGILLFQKDLIGITLLIFNTIIFFIFIYSIIIFFDIFKYVNLLRKYTDTDRVLDMLQKEIEDAVK